MTNAQNLLQQLNNTKAKNMLFLEKYFQDVYESFKDRSLTQAKINIDPNTMKLELLVGDKAHYQGDAHAYAKKEATQFSDAFKIGNGNLPLRHSYAGDFNQKRFFHGSLAKYLIEANATKEDLSIYRFDHEMPQVVFLGSGVGLHIKELLKIRPIRHVTLIEHDPDMFLASLYFTDWEEVISPYIGNNSRSFRFSVGDTTQSDENQRIHNAFATAWNGICLNVPFMPIQTFYYIHKGDEFYSKVADRLNKEIEPFVNVWGFYDDEINQLNHLTHNIKNKIPFLLTNNYSNIDKPVLICGNGPSLNDYIEFIKENRPFLTIVSAGSSSYTLQKEGIKPDIVVTLESDLVAYNAFKLLDKDHFKDTLLIGAGQIHPKTWSIFGHSLAYIKQETASSTAFKGILDSVIAGTPSASNAALAVLIDLDIKNLFIVGLDFGFAKDGKSHADSSFYYNKDLSNLDLVEDTKNYIASDTYYLEDNQHGNIMTTPFYNTCRVHAQRKIITSKRFDIHNLSKGATIEHCEFSDIKSLESATQNFKRKGNNIDLVSTLLTSSHIVSQKESEKAFGAIENHITTTCIKIYNLIDKMEPSRQSIDSTLTQVNAINIDTSHKVGSMSMFLRGSIWFWLYNFYALSKQINNQDKLPELTKLWQKHFLNFLNKLPQHFQNYINDTSEDDPKLNLTILDPEPNWEKWFK